MKPHMNFDQMNNWMEAELLELQDTAAARRDSLVEDLTAELELGGDVASFEEIKEEE